MSLHYIDEPYRTKIVDILSDTADSEILYQRLKVYLISEPYFKHFTSEPAWLTKEIIKDFKKGDENGEF
jgi:hypothetical protein